MCRKLQKAIFLDRDGVINRERGDYTFRESDFEILDGIVSRAKTYQDAGYLLIVITNQGGIGKGMFTQKDVEHLHNLMLKTFAAGGVTIAEIYYCRHHPTSSQCLCRKPGSLMLEKAIARFNIDPSLSYFIGDSPRDQQAGEAAGLKTIHIRANHLEDIDQQLVLTP